VGAASDCSDEFTALASSRNSRQLKAILIEALEPRQNRKRGDDLAGFEFIQ